MMKIVATKWGENSEKLRKALSENDGLKNCNYLDLVKLSFDIILNDGSPATARLDLGKITEVDDGGYQGTLLYLIPFDTYQPTEYEYLMTYVNYGSCSVCDTLQSIQDRNGDHKKLTKEQVDDFMALCKDILQNTICPYNFGWRASDKFNQFGSIY